MDVAVQWLTPKFGVRKEVGEGRMWGNLASVKMDLKLLREAEAQSFIFGQPEVLQSIQTEVSRFWCQLFLTPLKNKSVMMVSA